MSRPVSTTAKAALFAPQTGEAFLILLTLSHPNLATPIRVSSDAVNTASRGDLFIAYPFDLTLPDDEEQRPPRARLVIDNVDRQIVATIRTLQSAPTLLIEIVRANDPNTVEARFSDFKLFDITYDSQVITADLTLEDFTAEPYPAATFSPSLFPGLF